MKKKKSIGFILGLSLAALHLCLVIAAFIAYISSSSSTSALVFIWFFFLDAPVVLIPQFIFDIFGVAGPLISYGVLGSALWFLIPWLTDQALVAIFPGIGHARRWVAVIAVIPAVLICFAALGDFGIKRSIQSERPAELKPLLNSASSDFLTEQVVLRNKDYSSISGIRLMICKPEYGRQIIVSLPTGVAFLDHQYQEQERLIFDQTRFMTIEPVSITRPAACMYIAYKLFEGVYLYDREGKEKWNITPENPGGTAIDGVKAGDVNGDDRPEFAIYHRYREGILLVNEDGRTLWKHPVYALGHLEITDINEDGMDEIVFSNSNNASGDTVFSFLDATGAVASRLTISTASYEFAVIRWPAGGSKPNILLTEENQIRIVDLRGNTVLALTAPGSRPFGKVAAVPVKLSGTETAYLTVKKSLHPDLAVLYVYSPEGRLVYQKTDVIKGALAPVVSPVQNGDGGTEKLMVTASRNDQPQILTYSLSQ